MYRRFAPARLVTSNRGGGLDRINVDPHKLFNHVGDLANARVVTGRSGLWRRGGVVDWLARGDGWAPDRVLDLEKLISIRLALAADENVAIVTARTAAAQSPTDNASLDRGRHGTIFAQSPMLEFGLHPSTLRQPSNMEWSADRVRAVLEWCRSEWGDVDIEHLA